MVVIFFNLKRLFMNIIMQCGVLLVFLAAGEFIVWATGITLPSSIVGMLLLTLSLKIGIVKMRHVDNIADFLVHNLGFFFVPAGVGLISCLGLLADQWKPIVGSMVISTAVIMVITGHVHQLVRRYMRGSKRRGKIESKTTE